MENILSRRGAKAQSEEWRVKKSSIGRIKFQKGAKGRWEKIELEKYVKANSLEVYKSYYDNGISGAMPFDKRPLGSELLNYARAGKFSRVLITKLDRFGRDMYDSLTTIRKLKDYGVELKSINENTDDKIVLAVLLAVAEQERENTISVFKDC